MLGLVGIGTFAALTFARISMPSGRLKFSLYCVINQDDGQAKLMFRVVHMRNNLIMNMPILVCNYSSRLLTLMDKLKLN
jgi:inward rectifier potassium channel